MNNIQHNKQEQSQKSMCIQCEAFFGNPATLNMCSKCYKESSTKQSKKQIYPELTFDIPTRQLHPSDFHTPVKKSKITFNDNKLLKEEHSEDNIEVLEFQIKTLELEKEQPNKIIQLDHSKCFQCNRKVGFLGFKCKCEYTYCKAHRIPEEHQCDFDFKQEGKNILNQQLTKCKASQIEQI